MKLLIITRKVDKNDALAGFAYNWVKKIGQKVDKLFVVTWQKSERGDLPENIEIISLPENKLNKIFVLPKIVGKLLPQIDGIFCHMNPEYTILAALRVKIFCAKKNRKKIVSWYTHKAVTWRRHLMEKYADVILTASPESFRQPKYPNKVKVVGHGIDLEIFKPIVKNNNEDVFHIISIGRISPTKDYESIIKAVAINRDLPIRLVIIGDVVLKSHRQYFESLHRFVKKLNLNYGIGKNNKYPKVNFWGWMSNEKIPETFKTADLFINLSGTGSLDKAVLEAMACGCLVLTSNEAFKPILPAILMVEKNNPDALAEKIKMIINLSEAEKNELRQKLIQEVKTNHNLDNLVDKIISEFK